MLVKPMRFITRPVKAEQLVPGVAYVFTTWCCNYQIPLGISCW